MLRPSLVPFFALIGLTALVAPVRAEPVRFEPVTTGSIPARSAPAHSGDYGGGFIEMLMTGREPARARGALYQRPQADPAEAYGEALYGADPMARPGSPYGRPQPQRFAAISTPHATDYERPVARALDPKYLKQEVAYGGPHAAGTIVIDTPNRFLYLVQGGGRALRYGIGVGRPGFTWAGAKSVTRKAEWPDWRPPTEMLKRRPDLPTFMRGGEDNPLGARALYLGSSLYRIHGTNEPHTIGTAVSSGCIRMTNDDVVDLYGRVRVGTKVIVM